jgi:putative membrane-bound dehydrogenase-like protein
MAMNDAGPRSWLVTLPPLLLLSFVVSLGQSRAAEAHPIASPGNFELHPDLELSLFAREPDVVDPVALTFDEEGRVYVVEMRDYPLGIGPEHKPGGTIRRLVDTNGDGRADQSTMFAEGLSFPTSIAPWNGGVIVTAPPEVIFLKDRDGDGRADLREVLLTGFVLGVTDSNLNGLRWGLDNRLHGINGGNGGTIVSTRRAGPGVPLRELDFSFNPATGDFSPTFHTGGGFGLVFDEWGRSLVTHNINHMLLRVIPARYLTRFPGMPPSEAITSISDHESMARIYPVSEPTTRVNHPEQSGHFSSAGGVGYIGVAGYPADLSGSFVVCDVVGNLVHRDLLEPDGPILVARRSPTEQTREFFASRDPAFRPTGLELGPDGALYLLDMQRDVIEHPDYIPEPVKRTLNLRAGEERGRIYRLTPRGGLPAIKLNLHHAPSRELVGLLSHSNQWWRTTAQRLLVERADRAVVQELRAVTQGKAPLGQLHALWTLQGLGALKEPLILEAMANANPRLREHGLLLAESFLPGSPALQQRVLALANDIDPRVRFQAALTLGQLDAPGTLPALQRILSLDHNSRWTRLAVLSSLRRDESRLLENILADLAFRAPDPSRAQTIREVSELCGARAKTISALGQLLPLLDKTSLPDPLCLATVEGLHDGLTRSGTSLRADADPRVVDSLATLARRDSPALFAATWRLGRLLQAPETAAQSQALARAARVVTNASASLEARLAHIQLLALGDYARVSDSLLPLLAGTQSPGLQEAALAALGQFKDDALALALVRRWKTLAPTVRPGALRILLQRVAFHGALLDALEHERITLGELNLDLEQRRRLLRKSSPENQARAAKLMGDGEYSNRKSVVEQWLKKLPASGDAGRGRGVFEKTCASCHMLAGVGHQVGPDLGALAHRSAEDLLSNILDPNMAIQPNYLAFTAETTSGEIETGILQSETAESIVLLQGLGKRVVLARKDITRLESSGLSLMPEGLESALTPADLRDLIEFIQVKR